MVQKVHWAIFTNNDSQKERCIENILKGKLPDILKNLEALQGALFAKTTLQEFIDEEEKHDIKIITRDTRQRLSTMSSGEQKKILLNYLVNTGADFLILDNPFDNLDTESQKDLRILLGQLAETTLIIQFLSRRTDLLPFCKQWLFLEKSDLRPLSSPISNNLDPGEEPADTFSGTIPLPYRPTDYEGTHLIECRGISVLYGNKPILDRIEWTVKKGEFWQLRGPNGSGKSTLLSMITGDNHKGYGEELYLFGQRKGSGESVWDIKRKIGYYSPSMTDNFSGLHTAFNMIISGLNDSIGLYLLATENQKSLAKKWLQLLNMWHLRSTNFADLTTGQQRMIMTARAMVKHPPLLILDEPTTGLDDESAKLFIALVNKIAEESKTAIIFVSHRTEPGLKPQFIYELTKSPKGSIGKIVV